MTEAVRYAPGWPGIPPRWTSSAKTGVGTALGGASRVWFTVSHGILDEVYYPRNDQACIRDMGLVVTVGGQFVSINTAAVREPELVQRAATPPRRWPPPRPEFRSTGS